MHLHTERRPFNSAVEIDVPFKSFGSVSDERLQPETARCGPYRTADFQVLSNVQWALIEPMLPRSTGRRGRPLSDARSMVEGIIYRYRCGIAWRDLPEVFGPWQTVWTWHHRMAVDGTRDKVLTKHESGGRAA